MVRYQETSLLFVVKTKDKSSYLLISMLIRVSELISGEFPSIVDRDSILSKISGEIQAVEKVVLCNPTCLFQEEQIRSRFMKLVKKAKFPI
ncbi:hypothetical protein [Bacillus sp. T3]|uniref:hypothetical protein n=1 Tax=Bacillus sp. T3 TaxID=467262 RepID=UPI0029821CEF|nr:hypothetical protein [Bacillus sp. T3]